MVRACARRQPRRKPRRHLLDEQCRLPPHQVRYFLFLLGFCIVYCLHVNISLAALSKCHWVNNKWGRGKCDYCDSFLERPTSIMQVLASQLHYLANKNAELAIPPLFWPVNCIKIGGHVALLVTLLFIPYTVLIANQEYSRDWNSVIDVVADGKNNSTDAPDKSKNYTGIIIGVITLGVPFLVLIVVIFILLVQKRITKKRHQQAVKVKLGFFKYTLSIVWKSRYQFCLLNMSVIIYDCIYTNASLYWAIYVLYISHAPLKGMQLRKKSIYLKIFKD